MSENKQLTSLRLTPKAKRLLKLLAESKGVSQAAIVEMLVRELAKKEKVKCS
jgi:hypothetical protein